VWFGSASENDYDELDICGFDGSKSWSLVSGAYQKPPTMLLLLPLVLLLLRFAVLSVPDATVRATGP